MHHENCWFQLLDETMNTYLSELLLSDSREYSQDTFTFRSLQLENISEENLWKDYKLARK